MKKLFLAAFFLSVPFLTFAQVESKKLAVANGGVFTFNGPVPTENQSTFGVLEGETYRSIDTIGTTSVQDVITDGVFAYAAFEDTIVKYDLVNEERVGYIREPQSGFYATTLGLSAEYLIIGKDNSSESKLDFYDKESLGLSFSISNSDLEHYVDGIHVIGDSAYIVHNEPKKAETWIDSVAYLSVVDLSKKEVSRTIRLGEGLAGLGELFKNGDFLYGLGSGQLFQYSITEGTFEFYLSSAASSLIGGDQEFLYAQISSSNGSGIGRIAFDGLEIAPNDSILISSDKYAKTSLAGATLDTVSSTVYVSATDYSTRDTVFEFNTTGGLLLKEVVGFAPEAIDLSYNVLPNAVNDTAYTGTVSSQTINVLENDGDTDGTIQSISIVEYPKNGDVVLLGENEISYSANIGFEGVDSLKYVVYDEWGDTDSAFAYFYVGSVTSVERKADFSFEAYPNPCNDKLTIGLPSGEQGFYTLTNMAGSVVLEGKTSGLKMLSLSDLKSGVYFLTVQSNHHSFTQKILKK